MNMRQAGFGAVALLLTPLALEAQTDTAAAEPRAFLGGAAYYGRANGEFAHNVSGSGGLGGHLLIGLTPRANVGIRLSGMFLIYGSQTRRYSLLPGIGADVTTSNNIAGLMIGPQIQAGGRALKAYAFGGVGFSHFATTSSVRGTGNTSPFANSTNYDDITFAGEAGGGLLIRLGGQAYLDIGARYLNNGLVSYVTRSGVSVQGNNLIVSPVTSDADIVIYHLGITLGLTPNTMKRQH